MYFWQCHQWLLHLPSRKRLAWGPSRALEPLSSFVIERFASLPLLDVGQCVRSLGSSASADFPLLNELSESLLRYCCVRCIQLVGDRAEMSVTVLAHQYEQNSPLLSLLSRCLEELLRRHSNGTSSVPRILSFANSVTRQEEKLLIWDLYYRPNRLTRIDKLLFCNALNVAMSEESMSHSCNCHLIVPSAATNPLRLLGELTQNIDASSPGPSRTLFATSATSFTLQQVSTAAVIRAASLYKDLTYELSSEKYEEKKEKPLVTGHAEPGRTSLDECDVFISTGVTKALRARRSLRRIVIEPVGSVSQIGTQSTCRGLYDDSLYFNALHSVSTEALTA